MSVAVWILYAGDRLLDARLLDTQPRRAHELEVRHLFHYRHRREFLAGIGVASAVLAALLPRLASAAIELYLAEGAFLFGWFVILHATSSAHRLPKESAVGLFFAAAVFIPTVARVPAMRLPLLAPAMLFAALCALNCLYIYAWEHASSAGSPAHPTTRLALRHIRAIAVAIGVAALALAFGGVGPARLVAGAIAPAVLLLMLLDRERERMSATHLRAAADLVLLTPLLLLPLLR